MALFHTREVAARLLEKPLNTFAAERQRGELPMVWRGDSPAILSEAGVGVSEGAAAEARRGLTTGQIFITLIRDEFFRAFRMNRKFAAGIAAHAHGLLSDEWAVIADGSLAVSKGQKPRREVVFGVFDLANGKTIYACGSIDEIVDRLPAAPGSAAFVNVTRAAAVFRARAARESVDLGDFWSQW